MADPVSNSETRRKRFRLLGLALGATALLGAVYWLITHDHETTDDAFIEADVVQIAPQIGGQVAALHFIDNQRVTQGAPLLEIDPRDAEAAAAAARADLEVAQAEIASAQADLDLTKATTGASIDEARHGVEQSRQLVAQARQQAEAAQAEVVRTDLDVKRYEELSRSEFASHQRYEQAAADSRSSAARWRAAQMAATAGLAQQAQAEARLVDANAAPQRIAQKEAALTNAKARADQARAALIQAELNLSYTRVAAPQPGRMVRRAVNQGDVVQRNQVLASLVVDQPWVVANYKETQLARMRPGQAVRLSVDGMPGGDFAGRVDSIQAGTGARFSLLPAENATGNYVKVVQRVPVKIVFTDRADPRLPLLAPGMSVVPDVDVSGQ